MKKQKDPRHFPIDENYVKYINKHTKTGTLEEHERLVNKFYGYDKEERIIKKILNILGVIGYSMSISMFVFYTESYCAYDSILKFNPIAFVIVNLVFFMYFVFVGVLYK